MLRLLSILCSEDGRLAARSAIPPAQHCRLRRSISSRRTLGYNVFGAPIEYANYVGGNPHATWSGKFNPSKDVYLNSAAIARPRRSFTFGNTQAVQQLDSWI